MMSRSDAGHAQIANHSQARARNNLIWRDIAFSVTRRHGLCGPPETKHILRGISGSVAAGELFAILGPSGAGKTTLLNALTHEAFGGTARGSCTLNGVDIDEHIFHRQCCIVAQQDSHWAFLRCRETVSVCRDEPHEMFCVPYRLTISRRAGLHIHSHNAH